MAGTAIIIYTAVIAGTATVNITAAESIAGKTLRDCSRPVRCHHLQTCPSVGSTPDAGPGSSFSSPSFSCGYPSIVCFCTL